MIKVSLTKHLCSKLGIPQEAINHSNKKYSDVPNIQQAFQTAQQQVIANIPFREGIVLIDKDKCLEIIKKLETRKMDIAFQLRMLVFQRKIAEQQVELIMEAEQKKAVDDLFLEDGTEEEQVGFTFKELNLVQTPEFQAIATEL